MQGTRHTLMPSVYFVPRMAPPNRELDSNLTARVPVRTATSHLVGGSGVHIAKQVAMGSDRSHCCPRRVLAVCGLAQTSCTGLGCSSHCSVGCVTTQWSLQGVPVLRDRDEIHCCEQCERNPDHPKDCLICSTLCPRRRVQLGLEAGYDVFCGHGTKLLDESVGLFLVQPCLPEQKEEPLIVGGWWRIRHEGLDVFQCRMFPEGARPSQAPTILQLLLLRSLRTRCLMSIIQPQADPRRWCPVRRGRALCSEAHGGVSHAKKGKCLWTKKPHQFHVSASKV